MCRWLVYYGSERLLLADLVTNPDNSMIQQSYAEPYMPGVKVKKEEAKRLNHKINADGFGIGWYSDERAPCVFTSIKPSWNDRNLHRLADTISSKCVFAHVRAASPGSLIAESNCHPFQLGRVLFMHNGAIPDFQHMKRRFVMALNDKCYNFIQGSTDSEHCAALFVQNLPDQNPFVLHSCADMSKAMLQTIKQILEIIQPVSDQPCSLNFAVTNGTAVIATRFRNSRTEQPPSLYYTKRRTYECPRSRDIRRSESFDVGGPAAASDPASPLLEGYSRAKLVKLFKSVVISSEPLTRNEAEWELIPSNTMLIVTPAYKLLLEPIEIDDNLMAPGCEASDYDPNHKPFSAEDFHSPSSDCPPPAVPWTFPDLGAPRRGVLRNSVVDLPAFGRASATPAVDVPVTMTCTDVKNDASIVYHPSEIDAKVDAKQSTSRTPSRRPSATDIHATPELAHRATPPTRGVEQRLSPAGAPVLLNRSMEQRLLLAESSAVRPGPSAAPDAVSDARRLDAPHAASPAKPVAAAVPQPLSRGPDNGCLSLQLSCTIRRDVFWTVFFVLLALFTGRFFMT